MDFSIYLVESIAPSESFIKEESLAIAGRSSSENGDIYLFPADPHPAKWVEEVQTLWPELDTTRLFSARSGVLIALKQTHVTILATFGTGYLHINKDYVVPDFGRKVVITCVSPDQLKQVSRQAIEGAKLQSIEQTPKGESLDKYSIDYERDLLKGLAGIPRKKAFGDFIAGADALHVSIPGGILDLKKRVRLYLKAYILKIISPELRWYDRLKRVIDPSIKNQLDTKLDAAIQVASYIEPLLMIPDILDRTKTFYSYGFEHGTKRHPPAKYTDPDIDDWRRWLHTKHATPSLEEARKKNFFIYDASGNQVESYRFSQCLIWTCTLQGMSYFLHAGSWYSISTDLVYDVKNFLIETYKTKSHVAWPKYYGGDENTYNAGVAGSVPGMILMDKKSNIVLKGAKSAIEACDLIDIGSKLLVYVKRKKAGSSGLAHLFMQVQNGVDAFFSFDTSMRSEMLKRMPSNTSFDPDAIPKADQWTVVILILGVKRNRGLPFFSLMAAKQTISQLKRRYGLDICIEYA